MRPASALHWARRAGRAPRAPAAWTTTAFAQQAPAASLPPGMKAYVEPIAGTELKFEMVPIPGGSFVMGSPPNEPKRSEDEGPQVKVEIAPFWMGKHEVTWDEYDEFAFQMDLKRKKREGVDLTKQPDTEKASDAVTRPTPPYADETFGMGRPGQPVICVTHHSAMEYCRWLSAKTGKVVSPADRGRVGVRLPRRHQDGLLVRRRPRPARRIRLVRRELREAAAGRQEEAESVGPLRHARQRVGVVPGPLRRGHLQYISRKRSRCAGPSCSRRRRNIPTWPGAARGTTTPTGSAAPPGWPRTSSGACRTRSAPRASGGTPTPRSSASAVVRPLDEQENLKGVRSLVVKGKGTR